MLKLFNNRVALQTVDEQFDTEITLIGRKNLTYFLGRVHTIGPEGAGFLSAGEIVLFQMPTHPMTGAPYNAALFKFKGEELIVQHYRDMIARIKVNEGNKRIISLDTFEPLCNWVLLEAKVEKLGGGLLLPDNIRETPEFHRYYVTKTGSLVPQDLVRPGLEAVVDANRLNALKIGDKTYFYCLADQIYGVIDTASVTEIPDNVVVLQAESHAE